MPLTVQNLLDRVELELKPIACSPSSLRSELSWVLISELPDPVPYIEGGELVLTTGSRLSQGRAARTQYIGRLKDAGAAALGFGVSSFYPDVPADLVAAAQDADLPVLAVPTGTRFGAISRLVADCLADERQKELTFAVSAQRDLSRASLSPYAARAIVERLAKAIGGWALLLDQDGGYERTRQPGVPISRGSVSTCPGSGSAGLRAA